LVTQHSEMQSVVKIKLVEGQGAVGRKEHGSKSKQGLHPSPWTC